jgi:DNA-directed RNA polymerase beta' subunit
MNDYRNPNYINKLKKYINQFQLLDEAQFLGVINREEQLALMKGAKAVLEIEFKPVITVNMKHLNILINAMTYTGDIKPVNRYGIDADQSGVIAKASFEQPFDNFFDAASKGLKDTLDGVSASIMVGKLTRIGTGIVDIINMSDKEYSASKNALKTKSNNVSSKNIGKTKSPEKTKSSDDKKELISLNSYFDEQSEMF